MHQIVYTFSLNWEAFIFSSVLDENDVHKLFIYLLIKAFLSSGEIKDGVGFISSCVCHFFSSRNPNQRPWCLCEVWLPLPEHGNRLLSTLTLTGSERHFLQATSFLMVLVSFWFFSQEQPQRHKTAVIKNTNSPGETSTSLWIQFDLFLLSSTQRFEDERRCFLGLFKLFSSRYSRYKNLSMFIFSQCTKLLA